jgi:hypothetical protein
MDLARASALGRLGIGALLVASPRAVVEPWIGADARRTGPQVLARALGIRDGALGAGLLAAAAAPNQRRWLIAAVACDATDLAATLSAGDRLPLGGRVAVTLAAAGGVATGVAALAGR